MSYRSPAAGALSAFTHYPDATTRRGTEASRGRECPVCLGQHEEDIHIATIRVRRWFRAEVTKGFSRPTVC